jgi:uncharacterized protein HemX
MIELIAALGGLIFGAVTVLITVQQHIRTLRKDWRTQLEDEKSRHADANVKAYAAQRDFQHLERHLGQHKEAIKLLQEELEEMKCNQVEIRTIVKSIATSVENR